MKTFLAIVLATVLALPASGALARAGGWHGGGGYHGGYHGGYGYRHGGYWRNDAWVPFAVGTAIVGGVVASQCWRIIDAWDGPHRVWVC